MSILKEILENKKQEVARSKKTLPVVQLKDMPGSLRKCLSLLSALQTQSIAVIAEIKKASPSKGVIRENFDPVKIADEYISNGAAALSVLTDKKYFQGDIYFINDIRPIAPLPILRKDFIIDSYQLIEAKAFGADAILLIAAALEKEHLKDLHAEAHEMGLECLVEVHHERELETLDLVQTKIIGINNRNLSTFTVDTAITLRVALQIPQGITIVSESGISNRTDIDHLTAHGIHAVLIGESLMRAESPGQALQSLLTPMRDNKQ
jgi:indole-3-glycerol phosphate synthase